LNESYSWVKYEGEYAWKDVKNAVQEAGAYGVTPLIIRVKEVNQTAMQQLRSTGANFRKVEDINELTKVIANAYAQLTM